MEKTTETPCPQVIRDIKGRFIKGVSGNPKGGTPYKTIIPLLEALKKTGKKRGEDFWMMVANRCWTSDVILSAVLKKLLPEDNQDLNKADLIEEEIEIIPKNGGLTAEVKNRLNQFISN